MSGSFIAACASLAKQVSSNITPELAGPGIILPEACCDQTFVVNAKEEYECEQLCGGEAIGSLTRQLSPDG
jgi:hypothetical protein